VGRTLSDKALAMTALDHPRIDWVGLAQAYGVTAERADTAQALDQALAQAFGRRGPTLIEMAL